MDFAGTEYYLIEFNNAASGDLTAGSGTITLEFSSPPYGQPGETVLSFIAQPGSRADLDLTQFNTTESKYTTLQRSTLIEFLKDDIYANHLKFGKRIKEVSEIKGKVFIKFIN